MLNNPKLVNSILELQKKIINPSTTKTSKLIAEQEELKNQLTEDDEVFVLDEIVKINKAL